MDKVRKHEKELYTFTLDRLSKIDGVTVYGPKDPDRCIGVIPFNVDGIPNELVSAIFNYERAIATRNGCFCAHPYLHRLLSVSDPLQCKAMFDRGDVMFLPGAVRATIGIYNTREEMEEFLKMVEIITRRQWRGEYDLAKSSHCHPIRFTVKDSSGGNAACLPVDRHAQWECAVEPHGT
jgi:selenocysteine lyase/cysteine desulfurase